MIKKIHALIAGTALFLGLFSPAYAQTAGDPLPVETSLRKAVVDSIVRKYTPWSKINVSGKLSSPLLPVSATARIYMEKDRLTQISLSAIFVGEVARIEIDDKEVTIVNKYSRKYLTLSQAQFKELYPGGQSEIQNLLLGRVALLGKGQLTSKDASSLEIYDYYPDSWVLLPNEDFQQNGMVYLYSVARGSLNLFRFMLMDEYGEGQMVCSYQWGSGGSYTMDMEASLGSRAFSGQFQLGTPVKADKAMDRFKPDSGYQKIYTLRDLLR